MNNPSQSTHWTHRAASIFQIIFGIVGFIAALVFILPIARPIITVFYVSYVFMNYCLV